jgi:hypothetical protein
MPFCTAQAFDAIVKNGSAMLGNSPVGRSKSQPPLGARHDFIGVLALQHNVGKLTARVRIVRAARTFRD